MKVNFAKLCMKVWLEKATIVYFATTDFWGLKHETPKQKTKHIHNLPVCRKLYWNFETNGKTHVLFKCLF